MCRCLAVPSPPPRSTERHCTTWGLTRRVRNLISSLHTRKTETLAGLNADWITMFTQIVITSTSFAFKLNFAEELATFSTYKWLYMLLCNSFLIADVLGYNHDNIQHDGVHVNEGLCNYHKLPGLFVIPQWKPMSENTSASQQNPPVSLSRSLRWSVENGHVWEDESADRRRWTQHWDASALYR